MNYIVILLSHKTENDFSFCLLLKRITFSLILIIWKRITIINHNSFPQKSRLGFRNELF